MIIDTSALVAILRNEPEAKDCAVTIESNPIRNSSVMPFPSKRHELTSRFNCESYTKLQRA